MNTEPCQPIAAISILDSLLSNGIIEQKHYDLARQRLDEDSMGEIFCNAGEALIWMRFQGILSDEDQEKIEALSVSQGAFASNAARIEAVEQMRATFTRVAERRKQSNAALLDILFPGPRWVWMCGGAVLALAAAWYTFAPATTPGCNDSGVKQTYRSALYERSSKDVFLSRDASSAKYLLAEFSDVKELGYLKNERSRGCTATVKVGDRAIPVAYSITPTGKGSEMLVQGGDLRVFRARYQPFDEKLGQPVGVSSLRTAFAKGAEDLAERTRPAQQSAFDAARKRKREMQGLPPETDMRTVRNVNPLNNCRALGDGKWSCKVQAEYRDIVMSTLGQSEWQVMEGDFDFIQDGNTWRVSDGFVNQYMDATVRARVAVIKGAEAAEKLEQIQKERGESQ